MKKRIWADNLEVAKGMLREEGYSVISSKTIKKSTGPWDQGYYELVVKKKEKSKTV